MQKIKFKIEYKPLSDAAISKHKNFDALMGLYAAAPKPNFFQKLFQNKWMMFSGGIIIGSAITALIAINNIKENLTIVQNMSAQQNTQHQNTEMQGDLTATENILQNVGAITPMEQEMENSISDGETENKTSVESSFNQNTHQSESEIKEDKTNKVEKKSNIDEKQTARFEISSKLDEVAEPVEDENVISNISNEENGNLVSDEQNISSVLNENEQNIEPTKKDTEIYLTESSEEISAIKEKESPVLLQKKSIEDKKEEESLISESKKSGKEQSTEKEASSVKQEKKKKQKERSEKNSEDENTRTALKEQTNIPDDRVGKDSSAITLLDRLLDKKLFQKDSIRNDSLKIVEQQLSDVNDTIFQNRYAQLSFFTPLSTNGIGGQKFKHNFSFNIIQGFNGAVEGFEFGGVLNIDKGYVKGGQFAGVSNIIGGELNGFQGAGVLNVSKTVNGFQGAGVANVAFQNIKGFQGAGVMNVALKQTQGFQGAGVINVSLKDMHGIQAAGVSNVSLGKSHGAQFAGVLNITNEHNGAQIGLLNVSKKINGLQIGLVNLADTIDGVAIGLLSFSRNGIFDVDFSTNNLFTFNAAIRLGGPSVHNIFTFGTSPLADTIVYGYGIGIGGEIPLNKFYLDIDAITWDIHKDQFEFNYNDGIHINNQLRVTPGFRINKFISFYAGPVLNVEVYDNDIIPLQENPIKEFTGTNVTTSLSFGYVAGVRFF